MKTHARAIPPPGLANPIQAQGLRPGLIEGEVGGGGRVARWFLQPEKGSDPKNPSKHFIS